MTSKATNRTYWISTTLFALLMIFSAAGGLQPSQQAIQLMHNGLGYPIYFIQFISVAKVLGSIAILIPGFKRIKEWAYAGLFFDLAGAIFSGVAASDKFDPMMLTMVIWILPGILSYYYWHKKMNSNHAALKMKDRSYLYESAASHACVCCQVNKIYGNSNKLSSYSCIAFADIYNCRK